MRQFIALIHKDVGSDYGVSFPDLPGCITAGQSLDGTTAMAEETLALHVRGMIEDGETIPEPSSLESVMADRENRDAVVILVPLKLGAPKAIRVNVTIPLDVLDRIDRYAAANGMNRSGFLTFAAKREMGE